MKPTEQTVYLPVKVDEELPEKNYSDELHSDCGLVGFENGVFGKWDNTKGIWNYPVKVKTWLKQQEGYFFTPEQLNEYTANVIKQALETAAEKAEAIEGWNTGFSGNAASVDKKSITNTFDITFQKHKV